MSEFSDSQSDQSEFDSELHVFIKRLLGKEDDEENDVFSSAGEVEELLSSHAIETLGALLQTAAKADKALKKVDLDHPQLRVQQAKRQALGCALRFFADKLQEPEAPPHSEPYPVKWLYSNFPDSNNKSNGKGWLPLHWLVRASARDTCNDKIDVVESVPLVIDDASRLQDKHNVNFKYDVSPLSIAVAQAYPNVEVVKSLCQRFPKAMQIPDADGAYPFFYACAWNKETTVVEYLHGEYPQILDKSDNYGFRALHFASYVGQLEMIQFLLVKDPNAAKKSNKYGVLPLNACIVNKNSDLGMVKMIHMAYPKAISMQDEEGLLPIHKAAEHANLEIIKYLLGVYPQGATVPDNEGLLPLHYSGLRKDKSVVVQEFVLSHTPEAAQCPSMSKNSNKSKIKFKFW